MITTESIEINATRTGVHVGVVPVWLAACAGVGGARRRRKPALAHVVGAAPRGISPNDKGVAVRVRIAQGRTRRRRVAQLKTLRSVRDDDGWLETVHVHMTSVTREPGVLRPRHILTVCVFDIVGITIATALMFTAQGIVYRVFYVSL